jgi:hypothetical protein
LLSSIFYFYTISKMGEILATIRMCAKKIGPNCQPTSGNGGPIFGGLAKLGHPAGRTPYSNEQALSARDLVSAARPKQNVLNRFEYLWRCPNADGVVAMSAHLEAIGAACQSTQRKVPQVVRYGV